LAALPTPLPVQDMQPALHLEVEVGSAARGVLQVAQSTGAK